MSKKESSDLEELIRSSPTIVVARHRSDMAQDIPIENESSFSHIKTLLRQFDRVEVLRDEPGSVPPRFTVGDPNLATRMRLQQMGKENAGGLFPVYDGAPPQDPDGVVLFLRPSRENPGANFVFTVEGAVEHRSRKNEIEHLVEQCPYDPDAIPHFSKKPGPAKTAAPVRHVEDPPVPCHLQAEVRYFAKEATELVIDLAVSMDGHPLFRRDVRASGDTSDPRFMPYSFPRGTHRLLVVSRGMNLRFEKEINLTKPTWVVISYNHYDSDSTQRYKEGLSIEVYDHEIFPR